MLIRLTNSSQRYKFGNVTEYSKHTIQLSQEDEEPLDRRSGRSRDKFEERTKRKNADEWKYNDASSSSESEEERERPPPSKRVGARARATVQKKTLPKRRSQYSSEESSDADSDADKRRVVSRRANTTVSYKEDSEDEKTGSDELLDVDQAEPVEPIIEEKCETIEKVLGQRRGKKGGQLKNTNLIGAFY